MFFLLLGLWFHSIHLAAAPFQLPNRAKLTKGIVYKTTPVTSLSVDLYRPDSLSTKSTPVCVFIHGGSWMHGNSEEIQGGSFQQQMLFLLLNQGYSIVSVNYRLLSEKNNVHYREPLADCKDAVRWVRKESQTFHFDTCRIVVSGTSAGGHLALMTAYAPDSMAPGSPSLRAFSTRVNACVDFYGPTSLPSMLKPTMSHILLALASLTMRKQLQMRNILLTGFTGYSGAHPHKRREMCHYYSPLKYPENAVPTLIFHGDKDRMVPYKQTLLLQDELKQQNKIVKVVTLKGQDHTFPTLSPAQLSEILNGLTTFLGTYNLK